MKIHSAILSIAIAAGASLAAPAFAVLPATVDRSPVATSASAYSLCEAELRRRMGGTRSIVSISRTETTPSATMIQLAGEGTYQRDRSSQSQRFRFSCTVNPEQSRVVSLSYTFIQRLGGST